MQYQVLKKHEQKEFEKTREFIRNTVALFTETDNINRLTFDGKPANFNLTRFLKDEYNGDLKKASYDFNSVNKNYVMFSMQKLIKWCFKNKIQPSSMRQQGLRGVREVTFNDYVETEYVN